jgi:signal transduction histidine kinase
LIGLPGVSLLFTAEAIQNLTFIATLILLYNFIPNALLSRSRLAFSVCLGIIFGIAAALSIPALWLSSSAPVIGYNFILVPLAGFIGGPVSALFVAVVLLLGSTASNGAMSASDILTVMCGILLGALFSLSRSRDWFPRSPLVQYLLLGIGVAIIQVGVFAFSFVFGLVGTPGQQPGPVPILSILPYVLMSTAGTVLLGSIIGFIDRKKLAERELIEYKDHLETLVEERTAELRLANSLQEATIEATADGIVVTDRHDLIREYNTKAADILSLPGQKPSDLQDAQVYADHILASLSDPDAFIRLVAALPDSAEQIVTTDLKFASGRIYELYVHPQRIGDRIVGRVWSFHDITDQRLAEDAIAAANNKLILLSTLTRHDIFNQITALSAYLELIEMDNRNPGAAGHIGAMKKSLEVIRFQLEFTRDYQDLGLKKPTWNRVETAFNNAAGSFAGRKIAFRCESGNLEVFADPMIGQVFYNLMDNSLRHGSDRISAIRLSVRKEATGLVVVYEDDGIGIPQEEKEKIFLKGFGKHTGLGMFLIKEILSITGMTIRETGVYGQGVRFEILVPPDRFRFP